MSDIEVKNIDGIDVVKFLPKGVCSKLMELKIKDNIILELTTVGGCSGNLGGISSLIKGMNIHDVVKRLQGIPCGSRPTSCPDQLAQCIGMYLDLKKTTPVQV